jgi:dihydroorotase
VKSLLIRNGRLIDPSQNIDKIGDLFISEGKISGIIEDLLRSDFQVLSAEGLIICPGFIDFHCHLRQPGYEEKETIFTGTRAAAKGGFTTICCMPNTIPPLDNPMSIDFIKSVGAKEGTVRVLPIGCVSKERKGEEIAPMGELATAGVVGFSDDGSPVKSSSLMRQALDYSRALGRPVINHCESTDLSAGGQINEGVIALELRLPGIPSASEEIMVHRDLALARQLAGCHLHIAHVSTEGSVELIRRAKEQGISVSAEVTPHHLTLTEEAALGYDTNAKVSPPLRTKRDNQALINGLRENVIDIIATDHAPHAESDKQCEFTLAASGISVFETALGSLMGLVHEEQLTLAMLVAKLTVDPAKLLNDETLGTLKAGTSADITIFDPAKEWVVDTSTFISKGKNTPLGGSLMKGKVMATIYNGKLVYRDESIKLTTSQGNR